jgi:hypothetical protein
MPKLKLTADILSAALKGFEVQKNRIDAKIAEIRQMLDGVTARAGATNETGRPRRKRNAAIRRKMALAQKARWARIKQGSAPQPSAPATKKLKRTMSASARKRIAAAQKKRWAAIKKTA